MPGAEGQGLDAGAIAAALPAAAADGLPVVVDAAPVTLQPRFSEDDARQLATSVEALTAEPLTVDGRPGSPPCWPRRRCGTG